MRLISIITITFLIISNRSYADNTVHNTPVPESTMISCSVITPLSITPPNSIDYINWPSIPIGQKYILNSSPYEDADWKSIFTINGEPGYTIEISMVKQLEVDNVEISYILKGTNTQYLGVHMVPPMVFNSEGKSIVNLNDDGAYYVHIVYEWVWAKDNAIPGIKSFIQEITANYSAL